MFLKAVFTISPKTWFALNMFLSIGKVIYWLQTGIKHMKMI
jgi:hypothetical protein